MGVLELSAGVAIVWIAESWLLGELSVLVKVFVLTMVVGVYLWWNGRDGDSGEDVTEDVTPPSPSRLPLLGNLHHVLKQPNMPRLFQKLSREIGPVMSFWFGSKRVVVVNDFESVNEVLTNDVFADRPHRTAGSIINKTFTGIVLASPSPEYRKRKMLAHKLFRSGDQSLESNSRQECERLLGFIDSELNERPDEPVALNSYVRLVTRNIAHKALFSAHFKSVTDAEFAETSKMDQLMLKGMVMANVFEGFPFLAKLPIDAMKPMKEFVRMRDASMHKYMQEHLDSYDSEKTRDFADLLIKSSRARSSTINTAEDRDQTIADMYATSTETVSTALNWALLYLVRYPNTQQRLHAEIDTVLGTETPSMAYMSDMPYARAILLETLRKSSLTPLAVPHLARVDTQLGGRTVPKDTTIIPNIYAVHHDPELFPNPELFDPTRFLDPCSGEFNAKKKGFFGFSAGMRKCPGETDAKKEMFMFLVSLLQKFELSAGEDGMPSEEGKLATTYKPIEYKLNLRRR